MGGRTTSSFATISTRNASSPSSLTILCTSSRDAASRIASSCSATLAYAGSPGAGCTSISACASPSELVAGLRTSALASVPFALPKGSIGVFPSAPCWASSITLKPIAGSLCASASGIVWRASVAACTSSCSSMIFPLASWITRLPSGVITQTEQAKAGCP